MSETKRVTKTEVSIDIGGILFLAGGLVGIGLFALWAAGEIREAQAPRGDDQQIEALVDPQ